MDFQTSKRASITRATSKDANVIPTCDIISRRLPEFPEIPEVSELCLLLPECQTCNEIIDKDSRLVAARRAVREKLLCDNPVDARTTEEHAQKSEQGQSKKRKTVSTFGAKRTVTLGLPPVREMYDIDHSEDSQLGFFRRVFAKGTRQKRALFSISKDEIPNETDEEDILKHIGTLLMIDHINILPMLEACEDDNAIHLIYEWPDGGFVVNTLMEKHEEVSEQQIAQIIREVLGALASTHSFGIHHLDWSLLCLVLPHENQSSPVKIFGIGLAGVLTPLVTLQKGDQTSKHFYTSPDLHRIVRLKQLPPPQRHACDIWSVGVLAFMLCSGRPPFFGTHAEVERKIMKGRFVFGSEFDVLSGDCKTLIEACMIMKWQNRPGAVQLLAHRWLIPSGTSSRHESSICQDALTKLEKFTRETHCKQTLARLFADLGLQQDTFREVEDTFRQLDLNGNGVIEVDELAEVGKESSEFDASQITSVIMACDRNGNGAVDLSEFVAAVVFSLEKVDYKLLLKAFNKIDLNNDARLSKAEIFKCLRQYSGSIEPTEVSAFVTEADKDKDQMIDFEEFRAMLDTSAGGTEDTDLVNKRTQTVTEEITNTQKAFEKMTADCEIMLKRLRKLSLKLTDSNKKMNKNGTADPEFPAKIVAFHKIITDFIGKPIKRSKEDIAKKTQTETVDVRRSTIPAGMALMFNQSRAEPKKRTVTKDSGDSDGSGDEDRDASKLESATADVKGDAQRSIAEVYMRLRFSAEYDPEKELYADIRAPPGSETYKDMMNQRKMEWQRMVYRRRCQIWRIPEVKSIMEEEDEGGLGAEGGGRRSFMGAGRQSFMDAGRRSFMDAGRKSFNMEGEGESEGQQVGQPWSLSEVDIAHTREAMELAAGPIVNAIFADKDEQQLEWNQNEKQLRFEFRFGGKIGPDDLAAIPRLLQYKAVRTWLVPLTLWKDEIARAMQPKVGENDRIRTCKTCVKSLLQLAEEIMFSVADFIEVQEAALSASGALEGCPNIVPSSRPFLPHRFGDQMSSCRTPRDEEDADELIMEMTGLTTGRGVGAESAGSALFDDSMAGSATKGLAQRGPSRRASLDRNSIRAQKMGGGKIRGITESMSASGAASGRASFLGGSSSRASFSEGGARSSSRKSTFS